MRRNLCIAIALALLAGCGGRNTVPALHTASASETQSSQAQGHDTNQTTLSYYAIPARYSNPFTMIVGPDNALWFGVDNDDVSTNPPANPTQDGGIGRLAPDGTITMFDVQPVGSAPMLGAITPDGRIWFSMGGTNTGGFVSQSQNAVGNIASDGTVTSYQLPDTNWAHLRYSAVGSDGNIWFDAVGLNKVVRVTPSGGITEFTLPRTSNGPARPTDIVAGPDGAIWIVERIGNAIVRMTTDGTITNTFMTSAEASPYNMAVGDDGALWFTEQGSEAVYGDPFTPPQIVRMTTAGQMTAYPMPSALSTPATIRRAAGGFIFTDTGTNAVGFIDYNGNVVEWPFAVTGPWGIQSAAQGADGNYYFTDSDGDRIGKIALGKKGMIFPQSVTIAGVGNSQLVGVAVLGDRGPYTASTDNANVATVAPVSGFPMNFLVTAVAPGTTTLEIKAHDKPMSATITVTGAAGVKSQTFARSGGRARGRL